VVRIFESLRDHGRVYTQTLAEHDAHPVCRAEAAVIGDGFERPVATLQQHASGVDTGPLDEFVLA
jgi:hypothetical protein